MTALAAWREGIECVQAESGGMMQLCLIAPADAIDLTLAVAAGVPGADVLLRTTATAVEQVARAPRRKPSLCICCPRAVRKGDVFLVGVALPHRDHATTGIGFVVCERCSVAPGNLAERVIGGLRRLWPELRPVTVTHPEGGRA